MSNENKMKKSTKLLLLTFGGLGLFVSFFLIEADKGDIEDFEIQEVIILSVILFFIVTNLIRYYKEKRKEENESG